MKYSLVTGAEGHEFVNGNTKHLKDMDQKDLAVLHANGDVRIKQEDDTIVEKAVIIEEKKPAKAPVALPQ